MQQYTYYNAALTTQRIPNRTNLLPGDKLTVLYTSVEIDDAFNALNYRAPLTGLIAINTAINFIGELLPVVPPLARYTSGSTLAAAVRGVVGVTNSAGFTLTLPTAASVPANDTLFLFNDVNGGANNLTIAPNGTDTIEGAATLTRSGVVFAALSGIPSTVTVALVANVTTASGIHSIVEVAGVSTTINGDFASGDVTAQMVVDAITNGTGVTVAFAGSVNVSATTASPATVVAAAAAAPLVPTPVVLTPAANTLRFVSDGVSNWTTY